MLHRHCCDAWVLSAASKSSRPVLLLCPPHAQSSLFRLHTNKTSPAPAGLASTTRRRTFRQNELGGGHVTLSHHCQRIARHPGGQLPACGSACRGACRGALIPSRCRSTCRPAGGGLRWAGGGGEGRRRAQGSGARSWRGPCVAAHLRGPCEHAARCSRPTGGQEAPCRHGVCTCALRRRRPARDGNCKHGCWV